MQKSYGLFLTFIAVTAGIVGILWYRFPYVMDSTDNIAHFAWAVILLSALIPAAVFRFGTKPALKYGAAWAGIFLVLLIGYSYFEDLEGVGSRLKSNLFPFAATENANGSMSILRASDGHFLVEASVNNIPIQFMVDTGASRTSLSVSDAKRLGIDVDALSYTEPTQTANGLTFGAIVRLSEIRIGTIVVKDISASVSPNLSTHSLLGMNFLKQLKGFNIEGDRLTLEASES